jgi:hypothetical protein
MNNAWNHKIYKSQAVHHFTVGVVWMAVLYIDSIEQKLTIINHGTQENGDAQRVQPQRGTPDKWEIASKPHTSFQDTQGGCKATLF